MLHLESGRCSDVTCETLNMLAAKCNRWYEFVYEEYQCAMLIGFEFSNHPELYYCPCCEMPAMKLSGLFQHVESASCSQTLDDGAMGTLHRYLEAYI